jgi:hypothetical protein
VQTLFFLECGYVHAVGMPLHGSASELVHVMLLKRCMPVLHLETAPRVLLHCGECVLEGVQGALMVTQNSRVLRVETETGAMHTLPSRFPPRKLLTLDISPGGEHIAVSGDVIQISKETPQLPPASSPATAPPAVRKLTVIDNDVQASLDRGLADTFEETLVIAPRRKRSKKAAAFKGGGSGHEVAGRSPVEVWHKSGFVEHNLSQPSD